MQKTISFILFFLVLTVNAEQAKVAIIIDDIGYRQSDIEALELPGQITFAVLPHTPFGKILAEKAHAQRNEVILHIPMEATDGKVLGPGALTSSMNEENIRSTLTKSFDEIPFAIGINNHMGSHLTTLYQPMAWTMRFLKERNLLFIDSLTTPQSKAERVARYFGVPTRHRHIFLDNQLDSEYIGNQFSQLLYQANRYKSIIAIAHPHPETMAALKALLPKLKEHNISLVPISELLPVNNTIHQLAQVNED